MANTPPIANIDDMDLTPYGEREGFSASLAAIGRQLGARKLGCKLVVLAPGKRVWPYHLHQAEKEMFVTLEGIGTLRYDGERHPVRHGDVTFTPTGPGAAHQIINTSDAELHYMALAPTPKRKSANIRTQARSVLLAATYISSPRPAPRSTTGTARTARRKAPWHAPRRPRPCGGRPR